MWIFEPYVLINVVLIKKIDRVYLLLVTWRFAAISLTLSSDVGGVKLDEMSPLLLHLGQTALPSVLSILLRTRMRRSNPALWKVTLSTSSQKCPRGGAVLQLANRLNSVSFPASVKDRGNKKMIGTYQGTHYILTVF